MKNENICLVCINVAFANISAIQNVLDCNIAIQQTEVKGYGKMLTQTPYKIPNIPKADHYIFAGTGMLTSMNVSKLQGRKTVLITDSHYLNKTKTIDEIIKRENIEVFCMADLWDYCLLDKRMYIHPFIDFKINIEKAKKLRVCHSPFSNNKMKLKGSNYISKALSNLHTKGHIFDYECITGDSWKNTLNRKSKCHFFIDQLCIETHPSSKHYKGGIGKSGLEAMLLKCLTFSSGKRVDSDTPPPPYVIVNSIEELEDQLSYYMNNEKERTHLINTQYEWALKYTNPTLITQRITQ